MGFRRLSVYMVQPVRLLLLFSMLVSSTPVRFADYESLGLNFVLVFGLFLRYLIDARVRVGIDPNSCTLLVNETAK